MYLKNWKHFNCRLHPYRSGLAHFCCQGKLEGVGGEYLTFVGGGRAKIIPNTKC